MTARLSICPFGVNAENECQKVIRTLFGMPKDGSQRVLVYFIRPFRVVCAFTIDRSLTAHLPMAFTRQHLRTFGFQLCYDRISLNPIASS